MTTTGSRGGTGREKYLLHRVEIKILILKLASLPSFGGCAQSAKKVYSFIQPLLTFLNYKSSTRITKNTENEVKIKTPA